MYQAEVLSISKARRAFPTRGEHFKSTASISKARRAFPKRGGRTHTCCTHTRTSSSGGFGKNLCESNGFGKKSNAVFKRRTHMPSSSLNYPFTGLSYCLYNPCIRQKR